MRGSSLVFVWPVSVLLLAEAFHWQSLASVILVCAGLGLLGCYSNGRKAPGALPWALCTGVCIACYSLFYKLSLAHGAQPLALFSLSMAVGLSIQTCVYGSGREDGRLSVSFPKSQATFLAQASSVHWGSPSS